MRLAGAIDEEGRSLNVNADTVAGALAAALEAEKLVLITDIRGVVEYELAPHDPAASGLADFQDPDWPFLSLRLPASF